MKTLGGADENLRGTAHAALALKHTVEPEELLTAEGQRQPGQAANPLGNMAEPLHTVGPADDRKSRTPYPGERTKRR